MVSEEFVCGGVQITVEVNLTDGNWALVIRESQWKSFYKFLT